MATSSSALTPSTSSSSTLIPFNGTSTFSSSFQTVLNKAVEEASLPMEALQTDVTNLQSQQSALTSLESTFANLQSAHRAVSAAVSGAPSASCLILRRQRYRRFRRAARQLHDSGRQPGLRHDHHEREWFDHCGRSVFG